MLADHIGVPQLRDLASRSEQHSETLVVRDMGRLAGLLHPDADANAGQFALRVEFTGGMQGFPQVNGHVDGSVALLCQRCLGVLDWDVDLDFRLVVVGSEKDFDEVVDPFDALVAGEHGICLLEVVQDEVLASLPLAPMHAEGQTCSPAADIDNPEEGAQAPDTEMNKPFGNLADLMKGSDSPGSKN